MYKKHSPWGVLKNLHFLGCACFGYVGSWLIFDLFVVQLVPPENQEVNFRHLFIV
jgi:hypothetical protein